MTTTTSSNAVDIADLVEVGIEAYHYLYPLVTMDVTRRITTNVPPSAKPGFGPMNAFHHMRAFPDAAFRAVVRPNFDTLYSSAWLDLTSEPMVVSAADADGRYFLLPMLDLSELLPEPTARRIEARGGEVRLRSSATIVAASEDRVDVHSAGATWRAAAAIVAVGPHQLAHALAPGVAGLPGAADALDAVAAMRYEPTATIYLGFRERLRLRARMLRLDDAPGQWLFDRRDVIERAPDAAAARALQGLVAVVISAGGAHDDLDAKALAGRVHTQLKRLRPSFPVPVWSQVIVERRSTFACVPGLRRPATTALGPRLHLAGDYLDPALPATLESAVASGAGAGRAVARVLRHG